MKNRRPHKQRGVVIDGDVSKSTIITGDHNVVQISAPADPVAMALHQVPPPPADFTGRKEELDELLTAIEQGGVTISGLQGLGGIGKTALALKLAEQLKPRFPDAQFYLDLKGASSQPLTVSEALAHMVRAYHPAARLPDSEADLRGLYLSVLDGQRALLLMDNASNAEQVESLIPPAGCVLLVTSRQHFTVPGLSPKNLDALTVDDARALLLTMAPRIGEWADEIAKLCGYLPLALRLATAALVKYRNLKPKDYAHRLQDSQQRLQLIDASLNLSYELLSDELRERWRWLAVFNDSFADYSAAAIWELDVDQAQQMLGELMAASMVDWDETTGRYRLHDMARLFANARLSMDERMVGEKRYATHFNDVLVVANKLYEKGGAMLARGLALFDVEWNNIQEGHNWIAAQDIEADNDVALLAMSYPDAGYRILHLRQHPRERIQWLEFALAAARRLNNRTHESYALGNLGLAYKDLGENNRAIEFYEQVLLINRELGNRKDECASLNNLGIAYYLLGEVKRAVQFFDQTLLITREVGDREGEGHALGNLGNILTDIGETESAIELYEQFLSIARETHDRSSETIALTNLGQAFNDLGETERAIKFFEQALVIDRELGNRRGEGNVLVGISVALDGLGQCDNAIKYAEQALTIFDELEDPRAEVVREQIAEWHKGSEDK